MKKFNRCGKSLKLLRIGMVGIRLMVQNRQGVLAAVTSAIAMVHSNIDSVAINKLDEDYAEINFTVQVKDRQHLAQVMTELRKIPEVIRIHRLQE